MNLIPSERDYDAEYRRNRAIGKHAEEIALQKEIDRLKAAGRDDLAKSVQDVSMIPERGYDIKSSNDDGSSRYIEVKAVRWNGRQVSFYVSSYEIKKSRTLSHYYFYVVSKKGKSPIIH